MYRRRDSRSSASGITSVFSHFLSSSLYSERKSLLIISDNFLNVLKSEDTQIKLHFMTYTSQMVFQSEDTEIVFKSNRKKWGICLIITHCG